MPLAMCMTTVNCSWLSSVVRDLILKLPNQTPGLCQLQCHNGICDTMPGAGVAGHRLQRVPRPDQLLDPHVARPQHQLVVAVLAANKYFYTLVIDWLTLGSERDQCFTARAVGWR